VDIVFKGLTPKYPDKHCFKDKDYNSVLIEYKSVSEWRADSREGHNISKRGNINVVDVFLIPYDSVDEVKFINVEVSLRNNVNAFLFYADENTPKSSGKIHTYYDPEPTLTAEVPNNDDTISREPYDKYVDLNKKASNEESVAYKEPFEPPKREVDVLVDTENYPDNTFDIPLYNYKLVVPETIEGTTGSVFVSDIDDSSFVYCDLSYYPDYSVDLNYDYKDFISGKKFSLDYNPDAGYVSVPDNASQKSISSILVKMRSNISVHPCHKYGATKHECNEICKSCFYVMYGGSCSSWASDSNGNKAECAVVKYEGICLSDKTSVCPPVFVQVPLSTDKCTPELKAYMARQGLTSPTDSQCANWQYQWNRQAAVREARLGVAPGLGTGLRHECWDVSCSWNEPSVVYYLHKYIKVPNSDYNRLHLFVLGDNIDDLSIRGSNLSVFDYSIIVIPYNSNYDLDKKGKAVDTMLRRDLNYSYDNSYDFDEIRRLSLQESYFFSYLYWSDYMITEAVNNGMTVDLNPRGVAPNNIYYRPTMSFGKSNYLFVSVAVSVSSVFSFDVTIPIPKLVFIVEK